FKEDIRFRFSAKDEVVQWVSKAIRNEGFTAGAVNIVFCNDKFLRTINKRFLNHDYETDIVTFPTGDDPSVINGELYISVERVIENASSYGVSFNDELHRVIIHGILHLCNYSDKSPMKSKEMRKREDHYLARRTWIKK
ncbi:MAG: rRNA maturation RNase YbeY, partial [Bacteroidota bacterium]